MFHEHRVASVRRVGPRELHTEGIARPDAVHSPGPERAGSMHRCDMRDVCSGCMRGGGYRGHRCSPVVHRQAGYIGRGCHQSGRHVRGQPASQLRHRPEGQGSRGRAPGRSDHRSHVFGTIHAAAALMSVGSWMLFTMARWSSVVTERPLRVLLAECERSWEVLSLMLSTSRHSLTRARARMRRRRASMAADSPAV